MKSGTKISRALIVSILFHAIVGVIGFFFWIDSGPAKQQDSISAVLIKVDKPKLKRKTAPKRARVRKRTSDQTNQPRLKVLTSNAPVTARGVVSATAPTEFGATGSLDLSDGMNMDTNSVEFNQGSPQIGRVIENPIGRIYSEDARAKSRLVKFIERQEGPQQVAYCVDLSSSMLGLTPRKLKKILSIMQDSLTFLEPHDRFNIITFDSEINFFRDEFIPVTDDGVSEGTAHFELLSPKKSDTYADKDMIEAIQEIQKIPHTIVVLFSDGILTSGVPDPKMIRQTATASARIFSMGIEMPEDFPGAVMLAVLASNSDGEFWLVD
ncbi:MAG: hypothetical protein OXN17_17025 [Candidatus Poribacteria bacterium]|nr:hypothetical protein [Candidatus Poribacteria bacterium]MDE0502896.1 hypothetical protein [Candidatus Poribacteria bacterium]